MSGTELHMPDEAIRTAEHDLYEAFWYGKNELAYDAKHYGRGTAIAIAAPVVAAELRRLAGRLVGGSPEHSLLADRADELDGGAS